MDTVESKEIVIIMFQYSVVVKGIERKLGDMGYKVTTITDHLESRVRDVAGHADLFLFYLPADILSDTAKKRTLYMVCEATVDKDRDLILLGDQKDYDDLAGELPIIKDHEWLNRPIDMKLLQETVEKTLSKGRAIKKRRILIVDDDPSFAKMVREWIKDYYAVDIVTAGMQAISFLLKVPESEKVDMILLDYEMPVVDGPQVLQMLRQEPETADIPVIFLTGIGTKEAVSRVMALKPEGYILKSTSREQLLLFLKQKLA